MTEKRKPGRPAIDGATGLKRASIMLTGDQLAWIKTNGGSAKLRALISEAMLRKQRPS